MVYTAQNSREVESNSLVMRRHMKEYYKFQYFCAIHMKYYDNNSGRDKMISLLEYDAQWHWVN